jgi:photosystem II stability/assembly factor-like uncharacterized protein
MDEPEVQSRRARRALPLIAGALAAAVVAGLIYLHPTFPTRPQVTRPVPSPPVISGLYSAIFDFVTPSAGWALVFDKLEGPEHVYLFRTTDGAKLWKKEFSSSSPQGGVSGIRFFDRNAGLIFFGFPAQLYRTSDAGIHWTPVGLPPHSAISISFSDPAHGWVIAQEPEPGFATHLFATTNFGSSWTELSLPQGAVWRGKGGTGADPQFRRANDGWLGAVADRPTVYHSVDGGASWQPHILPILPAAVPDTGGKPIPPGFAYYVNVSLLPGSGVIALVDYVGFSGAYTSFDGGGTWRALALPPTEMAYSDFVFQDSTHWWAMRFGTLWKSSDAGQTWKYIGQQLDDFDYRPHVIDAKHAWAELLGSPGSQFQATGLAMTSDAALHWTYVNVPKPD